MPAPLRLRAEATALLIILQSEALATATIYARQRHGSQNGNEDGDSDSDSDSEGESCRGNKCTTSVRGSSSRSIRSAGPTASSTQVQLTSTGSGHLSTPLLHPTQILTPSTTASQASTINSPSSGMSKAGIAAAAIGAFVAIGLGVMAVLSLLSRRRRSRRNPRGVSILIDRDGSPKPRLPMSQQTPLIVPSTPNTPRSSNIQWQSPSYPTYQEFYPVRNPSFDSLVINGNSPASHYGRSFAPPMTTPAIPPPTYGPHSGMASPVSARQSPSVVSLDVTAELPYLEPSIRSPAAGPNSEPQTRSLHNEMQAYQKALERDSEKAAMEADYRNAQSGATHESLPIYRI